MLCFENLLKYSPMRILIYKKRWHKKQAKTHPGKWLTRIAKATSKRMNNFLPRSCPSPAPRETNKTESRVSNRSPLIPSIVGSFELVVDRHMPRSSHPCSAAGRSACHGHLCGPRSPRLRDCGVLLLPAGGPPLTDGVELHLLVSALLAAEGRVASVHEDVAVAAQTLGAERARVQRRRDGLAHRLGVEEEEGSRHDLLFSERCLELLEVRKRLELAQV
jgi:hypothetical protein